MAWARVQGNVSTESPTGSATKSVTFGAAVGSSNAVLGLVSWDNTGGNSLTSVTDDKGNTYNLETLVVDTINNQRNQAFSRTNITNAPITVTANFAASIGFAAILADEFSGASVASTDERDGSAHGGQTQAAPGTGADAITSGTFTTATDGNLLYGAVMVGNGLTPPSSGTGFSTGISASLTDYAVASEYRTQTTAGSGTAATFTQAANKDNTTFLISLKPAVTAGITFDAASNSTYQTAQSTYSWSHTCTGSNRYLTVGISMLSVGGSSVTGITYSGIALSLIKAQASGAGAIRSELWGLVAPATGSNTIAVTLSASLDSAAGAVSYTGVEQTTPYEAANSATATNVGAADATVNVTTIANNDWTFDNVATDDTAITVGAGQTSRNNVTGTLGSGAMSSEGPKTPAGSVTMSWTNVDALKTWAIVAAGLRPVAAGTAPPIRGPFDTRDHQPMVAQ